MKEKTIIVGKPNTRRMIKSITRLRTALIIFLVLIVLLRILVYIFPYSFILECITYLIYCPLVLVMVAYLLYILAYKYCSKTAITVTDKRIYGTAVWSKRVDLPLDSISSVGIAKFKTIAVSTSSGFIKFAAIENFEEIHHEISKLLVLRQDKPKISATVINQVQQENTVDELKKYKGLLDSGILTQEEFDAKKKQLLGL